MESETLIREDVADAETVINVSTPSSPATAAAQKEAEKNKAQAPEADETRDKGTIYYVLAGEHEDGPFNLVGKFEAAGQIAAKKLAVVAENEINGKAAEKYFLAVPQSSYMPQKPSVEVTTLVTF